MKTDFHKVSCCHSSAGGVDIAQYTGLSTSGVGSWLNPVVVDILLWVSGSGLLSGC